MRTTICPRCGTTYTRGQAQLHWQTTEHKLDAAARFWGRATREPNGCLVWRGSRIKRGYGVWKGSLFGLRAMDYTHRISFVLTNGAIPPGLFVLHHCDNPPCIEPTHLFVGTHRDNVADMWAKGRGRTCVLTGEAHPMHRLRASDVRTIRNSADRSSILAAQYGVHRMTIARIRSGRAWKAVA